jgi:hypothetical protein
LGAETETADVGNLKNHFGRSANLDCRGLIGLSWRLSLETTGTVPFLLTVSGLSGQKMPTVRAFSRLSRFKVLTVSETATVAV